VPTAACCIHNLSWCALLKLALSRTRTSHVMAWSKCARHLAVQAEPDVMQRLMGVPRITDSIRAHYSRVASPDALAPAAGADHEDNIIYEVYKLAISFYAYSTTVDRYARSRQMEKTKGKQ